MALDITILNEEGYPTDTVSIGVDEHYMLMQSILNLQLLLLSRLEDYYEDVEFRMDEIEQFLSEVEQLLASCSEERILKQLNLLKELGKRAQEKGTGIVAIAD